MSPRRIALAAAAAVAVVTVAAGCSDSTYEERLTFLHKVAERGVDTYKLLYSQEAKIDKERCERAFNGSGADGDAPSDMATGGRTPQWQGQIKEFFVDSCVSGKPKPLPGQSPAASPAASPSGDTFGSGGPAQTATP